MEFLIEPYVGVGTIKLGMNQKDIQEVLNEEPRRFRKFQDDEYETEAYEYFYVYYKNPGICEAIEFFNPAKVILNGITLLELPYKDIEEYFLKIDKDVEIEETGLTSYKYGVGIYAPYALDEPLEKAEGVIVFEKGYYE